MTALRAAQDAEAAMAAEASKEAAAATVAASGGEGQEAQEATAASKAAEGAQAAETSPSLAPVEAGALAPVANGTSPTAEDDAQAATKTTSLAPVEDDGVAVAPVVAVNGSTPAATAANASAAVVVAAPTAAKAEQQKEGDSDNGYGATWEEEHQGSAAADQNFLKDDAHNFDAVAREAEEEARMVRGGGKKSKEAPDAKASHDERGEDPEEAMGRMTFDESKGFREQGFTGPVVAHDDKKTTTSDWRTEYGPGHHDTQESICKRFPKNWWCIRNGYVKKPVGLKISDWTVQDGLNGAETQV